MAAYRLDGGLLGQRRLLCAMGLAQVLSFLLVLCGECAWVTALRGGRTARR
jgi:hypothetical protein